jgi:hypothetical protein
MKQDAPPSGLERIGMHCRVPSITAGASIQDSDVVPTEVPTGQFRITRAKIPGAHNLTITGDQAGACGSRDGAQIPRSNQRFPESADCRSWSWTRQQRGYQVGRMGLAH